jgi:hypothetical protein
VIGFVPASLLSRVRSSSLHDCFQRAMSLVPPQKPPLPTRILVEYVWNRAAPGVPPAARGVPSALRVLAQTALVARWLRSLSHWLRAGFVVSLATTIPCATRRANTQTTGQSALAKIFHFTEILIWRSRVPPHPCQRGVSRSSRTRGESWWTPTASARRHRRAGNRERWRRAHDRCGQRTVKPCRPDARGLCVKSCGDVAARPGTRISDLQGDGGNSASLPGESSA